MNLSEAESMAREHFLLLITESTENECNSELLNTELPSWYDDKKYKQGQKFYIDNRLGVLNATIIGAIASLSDNKALKVLASTGKSSTKETAGPRYFSTVLHFMNWYENVLCIPNSEARKSLDKVRKMHVLNSKRAKEIGLGAIKQFELILTAFGFYAYVIFRPHLFGIYAVNNQEDREGFIHFWAVVSRMIGIRDKYNICLLPFDVIEILFGMISRYILLPLMLVETALHKQMMTAFTEGFAQYFNHPIEYESQMFLTRMICGVPGYQYKCDLNRELFSRSGILSDRDIADCNKVLKSCMGEDVFEITYDMPVPIKDLENGQIQFKYVNYEDDWKNYLNDSKFYEMNWNSRLIIRMHHYFTKLYEYSITRYLFECLASWNISRIKKIKF